MDDEDGESDDYEAFDEFEELNNGSPRDTQKLNTVKLRKSVLLDHPPSRSNN